MNFDEINQKTFKEFENPFIYFLFRDSLHNIGYGYSALLSFYHCAAGCDMCYVQDYWQSMGAYKEQNQILTPDIILKRHNAIQRVFNRVELVDNVGLVNRKFPHLADAFNSITDQYLAHSATDKGIIRFSKELDIAKFKEIETISLSDKFLMSRPKQVLEAIHRIIEMYGRIEFFHFIGTEPKLMDDIRLIDYIKTIKQHCDKTVYIADFRIDDDSFRSKIGRNPLFDYMEEAIYVEDEQMYTRFECGLFSAGDMFYDKTFDVINPHKGEPICSIYEDDCTIISKVLERKVMRYKEYSTLIKNKDTKHFKYFDAIGNGFVVNHDFNFIPMPLINWRFKLIHNLMDAGWIKTKNGLVKDLNLDIVPIIERIQ